MRIARSLQNQYWRDAIHDLSSPTASPHAISFSSLPDHWKMISRIKTESASQNLVPSGDFEVSKLTSDSKWKAIAPQNDNIRNSVAIVDDGTQVITIVDDDEAAPIVGGSQSDRLIGTSADDRIAGQGGNDTVFALGGDDFVAAGSGRDFLFGGTGNDTLTGARFDLLTTNATLTMNGGGDEDILTGTLRDLTATSSTLVLNGGAADDTGALIRDALKRLAPKG